MNTSIQENNLKLSHINNFIIIKVHEFYHYICSFLKNNPSCILKIHLLLLETYEFFKVKKSCKLYKNELLCNFLVVVFKFYYIVTLFYVVWEVIYKFNSHISWALFEFFFGVVLFYREVVFTRGIVTVNA